MKQNPFSLYDFMGYFIPGAVFIYLIKIIEIIKINKCIDLNTILGSFPSIKIEGVLFFLILSYVFGHIISFISSITVETYANWIYGYPSRFLLQLKDPHPNLNGNHIQIIIWRIIIIIVLLPIVILDIILGKVLGFKNFYSKKLDDFLIKIVVFKANKLLLKLGITDKNGFTKGEANKSDFYRLIMHYTYENSKNHQNKFINYVALYGFLRTLTFILNMLFWYYILHTLIFGEFCFQSILISSFLSIISYVFFMAFMKFYRRYTLEGFMILAVDKDLI